jgi:hypothetical protein
MPASVWLLGLTENQTANMYDFRLSVAAMLVSRNSGTTC